MSIKKFKAEGTCMIKRFIIVLLVLIVIFGGIFGYKAYKGYEIAQFMKHMKFPPVSVSVAVSKIGNWRPYIHTIGNVSAINSVIKIKFW